MDPRGSQRQRGNASPGNSAGSPHTHRKQLKRPWERPQKDRRRPPILTFLMSVLVRSPQPRCRVRKISTSGYWRLEKHWFWQRPPAGHTVGWHSYNSMRLMHSESMPQGFSSVALQLQRGISDRSAVKIWTLPMGRFTWGEVWAWRTWGKRQRQPGCGRRDSGRAQGHSPGRNTGTAISIMIGGWRSNPSEHPRKDGGPRRYNSKEGASLQSQE